MDFLERYLLSASCAEQGMNINVISYHNPQATELQKKEEAKPNPSGLKREGYVPGEILVKLYNRFAILYPGAGLRRLKKRKFLYNKVQGWHKKTIHRDYSKETISEKHSFDLQPKSLSDVNSGRLFS